ncbi:MAG: gfo/Idh/MocA family oxidoreductase [Deltaproteobacteria bacterium]|nr:MAG: gfo/Idh/MocA family oxidoreductase [Deltaproteobacteria bacterium]
MEKIKVGVIGVGYLGRIHAQKYARIPEAELIGVVDIDEERCQEVAACTNCQPFYRHLDLLGLVEAVSVAVPTIYHYQITKDFFLAGVDVLLEKPIAATVKEAKELNALAQERKLVFQIGHLERFNGALAAMNGVLKDPFLIESYRLSPFTGRGTDVDVILDLMIHDIDIILSIVDSELDSVEAVGMPFFSSQIDVAHARITFKDGCVAHISASRIAQERLRKMIVLQKDTHLEVDYLRQSLLVTRKEQEGITRAEVVRENDPLEMELKAFLQSVRKRTPPMVSGEDGQRALEVALKVIDAIEKSIKKWR